MIATFGLQYFSFWSAHRAIIIINTQKLKMLLKEKLIKYNYISKRINSVFFIRHKSRSIGMLLYF